MDAREIGEKLTIALKLPGRALGVVASDEPLDGSTPIGKVETCIARAIYMIAMDGDRGPAHFGPSAREGVCPGGQGWCGVSTMSSKIKYFISTGTPEFRHGEAEYLKPNPEAAERFFFAPGKIVLPSKLISIAGWDQLEAKHHVLSYILIGTAESIRNAGGLIQFISDDLFRSVMMPGGPSCASLITYAAGMAENAPRDTAFVGPVDPTGNAWFPPEMMSLAVPYEMARRMAESVDASFLGKRAQVAFPPKRLGMGEKRM